MGARAQKKEKSRKAARKAEIQKLKKKVAAAKKRQEKYHKRKAAAKKAEKSQKKKHHAEKAKKQAAKKAAAAKKLKAARAQRERRAKAQKKARARRNRVVRRCTSTQRWAKCTAHPISWYTDCKGPGTQRVTWKRCGFLNAGGQYLCKRTTCRMVRVRI